MAEKEGEYRLIMNDDSISFGDGEKGRWEEQKVIFYISESVYTLKAGREIFSIPKRTVGEEEEKELLRLMDKRAGQILRIQIRKV